MQTTHSWTIGRKIAASTAFWLANVIGLGVVAYASSRAMQLGLDDIVHVQMPAVRNMTLADMMHDGIRAGVFHALLSMPAADAAERQAMVDETDAMCGDFAKYIAVIESLPICEPTRAAVLGVKPRMEQYAVGAKDVVAKAFAGRMEEANAAMPAFLALFEELEGANVTLADRIDADAQARVAAAEASANDARTAVVAAALIGALCGVLGAGLLARRLVGSVGELARVAGLASNGDFTSRAAVRGGDELADVGSAFNTMFTTLGQVLGGVRLTAGRVDAAAASIADRTKGLADISSTQAASIVEIAASLAEMNNGIAAAATQLGEASTLAGNAKQSADRGETEMTSLSEAMQQIVNSSSEIAKVITVINDIAFQTNLLALNAAVEAARAGEAGRSFAVVADEVRSLAQRSAKAAENTSSMIAASSQRALKGAEIAKGVSQALLQIQGGTGQVRDLLVAVASRSQEHAQGVAEVHRGVAGLSRSTQVTADSSSELDASAEECAASMRDLTQQIDRLRV